VLDIKQMRKSAVQERLNRQQRHSAFKAVGSATTGTRRGAIATQARSNEIGKLVGQKFKPVPIPKLQKFRAFENKAIKSKPRLAN